MNNNLQTLVNELKLNRDFIILYNYDYRYIDICNGGFGRLNSNFSTIELFVDTFAHKMLYFPSSLFNDNIQLTRQELLECKNYIIDLLFVTCCIDKFVQKYFGDVITAQDKFSGFSIVDFNENFQNARVIRFDMIDRYIPLAISIFIAPPTFIINKYENFNTIQDFLNSNGEFTIYIKCTNRACAEYRTKFKASEFNNFTKFLKQGLIQFRQDNSL